MRTKTTSALAAAVLLMAGCGGPSGSGTQSAEAAVPDPSLPEVVVYKSASCGCCNGWVEHLRQAGFRVDARNMTDLRGVNRDAGVPDELLSCHMALVDGYVVEGHVPADQIKRMLADRPDIIGISAPGMPVGSPGMEGPGARPYQVIAFDHQGGKSVYAEVDPR